VFVRFPRLNASAREYWPAPVVVTDTSVESSRRVLLLNGDEANSMLEEKSTPVDDNAEFLNSRNELATGQLLNWRFSPELLVDVAVNDVASTMM